MITDFIDYYFIHWELHDYSPKTFVAAAHLAEFSLDFIFVDVLKDLSVHVCPVCAVLSNLTRCTRLTGPTPAVNGFLWCYGILPPLCGDMLPVKTPYLRSIRK